MHSSIQERETGERAARPTGANAGSDPHAERRHSFRVHTEGRATLWHKHELLGSFALRDLCLQGCALIGTPRCALGTHVEVALHLCDRSRPLWLTAEVRRGDAQSVGLCFTSMPARVEDRLQDLVVDTYARAHEDGDRFSLVIDPRPALRSTLARELDAIGERAVAIATPLDAVQLLLERGARVTTAFIGPQPSHQPSFELAEFLARHYPHVRRVLIGDASEVAESWVASATGEAHAVLELPCPEDTLRALVHRIGMLPRDTRG
ncbi:MAG: PilZ domain-containing protein [Polyangiales bacterium]